MHRIWNMDSHWTEKQSERVRKNQYWRLWRQVVFKKMLEFDHFASFLPLSLLDVVSHPVRRITPWLIWYHDAMSNIPKPGLNLALLPHLATGDCQKSTKSLTKATSILLGVNVVMCVVIALYCYARQITSKTKLMFKQYFSLSIERSSGEKCSWGEVLSPAITIQSLHIIPLGVPWIGWNFELPSTLKLLLQPWMKFEKHLAEFATFPFLTTKTKQVTNLEMTATLFTTLFTLWTRLHSIRNFAPMHHNVHTWAPKLRSLMTETQFHESHPLDKKQQRMYGKKKAWSGTAVCFGSLEEHLMHACMHLVCV